MVDSLWLRILLKENSTKLQFTLSGSTLVLLPTA